MYINILGSLQVRQGNDCILPTASKPRKVLALLLTHANQMVPNLALIEELWDENPPKSAMTTLQTYILHLRKSLSAGLGMESSTVAEKILVTKANGYLFKVQSGELDLHRFEQLAARGRKALAEGDNDSAAELLRSALGLWRGPALDDIQAGRLLEAQIIRLEELRLTTLEQRIEADLRLGRHHEVLCELAALATHHSFNENLHAQLMLALHRSGRRSDALMVFRRLRTALTEELGLEPSLKIQQLHQAILSSDPAIELPDEAHRSSVRDQLSFCVPLGTPPTGRSKSWDKKAITTTTTC